MICHRSCHLLDIARVLAMLVVALAVSITTASAQNVINANTDSPVAQPPSEPAPAAPEAPLARASLRNQTPSSAPDNTPASPLEQQILAPRDPDILTSSSTSRRTTSMPSVWRSLGSLILVLAIIAAATLLLRHYAFGRRTTGQLAGIEVIARSALNTKQSLCVVKLGRQLLLLGLSPNHIAPLQTIDEPDDVAALLGALETEKPHSISRSFSRLFQREADFYKPSPSGKGWPEGTGEGSADQASNADLEPWARASGELSSLLNKVKGLSRIRFRP